MAEGLSVDLSVFAAEEGAVEGEAAVVAEEEEKGTTGVGPLWEAGEAGCPEASDTVGRAIGGRCALSLGGPSL